ncbi:non-ribosomal peptide synthetase [Plantactinospora endophytica]|uniref:Carrier domain-containing protein n=1 Tax=Plantactinospora endophytica TaxID=673535 RepID=A0ABQ4EEQ3_9ACTN|nr:non-ribosomal peptide synthetase [Plantactinospora endophytica]GIG93139.1 hypothetical protein Pen02_80750 [Plantactinospora endophytica]
MKRVVRAGFAQERMWLHNRLGGTTAYHESVAVELRGRLDVSVLRQALQDITGRHDVLRSGFEEHDGVVTQVTRPYVPARCVVVDLADEPDPAAALENLLEVEPAREFVLRQPPLLRCTVARLAADRQVLLFVQHHLICDEHSWGLLLAEVFGGYADRLDGIGPAPAGGQYAEHAERERDRLQGGRSLAYWRDALASGPVTHPLPQRRAATGDHRPAREVRLPIPAGVRDAVLRFARERRLTLFTVYFAALAYVLHRHSGAERLAIGTPVTTRTEPDTFSVLGPFINTCLLPVDLRGEPTVAEFLRRCRNAVVGMLEHRSLPFETLLNELRARPGTAAGDEPVQVMFNLREFDERRVIPWARRLERAGLDVALVPTRGVAAKLPLSVFVRADDGRPELVAEYDGARLAEATVRTLLVQQLAAVGEMIRASDGRLSDVDLLVGEPTGWEQGPLRPTADGETVVGLISARVAERPDAPAVTDASRTLTYARLDDVASRLARRLREAGVGPDVVVAVAGSRSSRVLAALLGVLKAGGAYLPLDPAYPAARLAHMLRDSGARILLAEPGIAVPHVDGVRTMPLADDGDASEGAAADKPVPGPAPSDLAYVMYTSGTTGVPNGVMVEHRALANHAHAAVDAFGLGPTDRVLQFAPLSFDVSVEEIFPTWCAGGCVHVQPERLLTHHTLARLIADAGVTVANLPTAYWTQWAEQRRRAPDALPATLRLVVVGGSAVPAWAALRPEDTHTVLLNGYGVTEATITSTTGPVDADPGGDGATAPIGRPVLNTVVRVLDERGRRIPAGVPGELYVGGAGLARGYIGRPDLTARRFVPDPFGAPGARLYRTGDRVRRLPDGRLEFLGRVDEQLAVGGHRVEPVEIEATLGQHPRLAASAVGLRDGRLVAWVVPAPDVPAPDPTALRNWAAARLPAHLVPRVWEPVAALPLSPSGKVDRDRLPRPGEVPPVPARFPAISDPTQRTLAEVWQQVLNRPSVGPDENFFALGGDSFASLRIAARAAEYGLAVDPRDVLRLPTVAELSTTVTIQDTTVAEPEAVDVTDGDGLVPLTPIQRWYFALANPTPQHWDQVTIVPLRRSLDVALLERAADIVVNRHESLRLRYAPAAGGWRQWLGPSNGGGALVHRTDLSTMDSADRVDALEREAERLQRARVLADGPLLILLYGSTPSAEPDLLLVSVHHLAMDALSAHFLRDDLLDAYRQVATGDRPSSASPTLPYPAWARHLARYATSPAVRAAVPYWMAATAPGAVTVDVDHSTGPAEEGSVAFAFAHLDAASTTTLGTRFSGRLAEVALGALLWTVGDRAGRGDVVVDVLDHGRRPADPSLDVSRTLGWFTAIFPLRVPVPPGADVADTVAETGERWRDVPHHGLSYGLLRYPPAGAPSVPASPAGLSFNYVGVVDRAPVASGTPAGRPLRVRSPRALRSWPVSVFASLVDGALTLQFGYSRNLHRGVTIEALAAGCRDALRRLAAGEGAGRGRGPTKDQR